MKAVLEFLTKDEVERIHEASVLILEETGIRVYSAQVRKLLADHGAKAKDLIVKIPKGLVEDAITKIRQDVTLAALDPACDLRLPSDDSPFVATSGYSPFVTDYETGKTRSSTTSDLAAFATVSDYLDAVDYFWPSVFPTEAPPVLQEFEALAVSLKHTRKHIQCSCSTPETAHWQIELASAIVGGREELKKRPIFSAVSAPIAPLTFGKEASEAMVLLAGAGIPIVPMTMVLASTTAPATVAGTLAMANAEELACLVIIKCANPDAPVVYASEASVAHKITGKFNYDSPEYPLLSAGCAQLARFYNMPSMVGDVPLEVMPGDLLSLERNVLRVVLAFLTRTDLSAFLGSVDLAASASLAQLVVDAEACEHARAYLRSFDLNEDTLALDIIGKVGPGGHFLGQAHTKNHFRGEIWTRGLQEFFILDRFSENSIPERAVAKVKEILSSCKSMAKFNLAETAEEVARAAREDLLAGGRSVVSR